MKTQSNINKLVNVLGYIYLTAATSAITWMIKTFIEITLF